MDLINDILAEEKGEQVSTDSRQSEEKVASSWKMDVGEFSKAFGVQVDSEDGLKGLIEKGNKFDDVYSQLNDVIKKNEELSTLANRKADPLDWFASEDEFIRNQFLKNKAKEFTPEAVEVVSKLSPAKVKSLSDWEALKMDMFVSNQDLEGGVAGVEELLMDRYGIDDADPSDWDTKTINKVKVEAKAAKERLNSLFSDIKLPERIDVADMKNTLKETWSSPVNEIVKGIDKLSLAEGVDFVVTDEMKKGIEEEVLSELVLSGVKPSEEEGQKIAASVRTRLLERNLDGIVKFMRSSIEEQVKETYREKYGAKAPLSTSSKDTTSHDNSPDAVIDRIFG